MPAEKFYPSTAVENQPSDYVEVAWHRQYPGVDVTMLPYNQPPVSIDLDRSGINRLIKVLRKAREQTFGADE